MGNQYCGIVVVLLCAGGWYWKTAVGRELARDSLKGHFDIYSTINKFQRERKSLPTQITELIQEGYLAELPTNPYTNLPMRNIKIGAPHSPGDYTYLRDEDLSAFKPAPEQRIPGFFILGHGSRPERIIQADFDGNGTLDDFDLVIDVHPVDGKVSCISRTNDWLDWTAQEIIDCFNNGTLPAHHLAE